MTPITLAAPAEVETCTPRDQCTEELHPIQNPEPALNKTSDALGCV